MKIDIFHEYGYGMIKKNDKGNEESVRSQNERRVFKKLEKKIHKQMSVCC